MDNKNIMIVNEYAGTPEYGMIHRHYYLAKELVKKGYRVTVVSASYSHLLNKYPNMENKKYKYEDIDGIDFLWINVNRYDGANDKKRVLKWFNFAFKMLSLDKVVKYKPDVIIWSSSAQFSGVATYYLAKKLKIKFILEVRDIWPLTLTDVGSISPKHPLIRLMSLAEKFVIRKADVIVSNLQNYENYIKELGFNKKVHWISNGVDLDEMNQVKPLDKEIEALVPKNKFIVGHTGKMGVTNAVKLFIDAAKEMQEYKDIVFVLVGDGNEKPMLQEEAKDLNNVVFIPLIPKTQVQSILALFDICYIGWKEKRLYTYGVSPNKIYDYMYAQKPFIYPKSKFRTFLKELPCAFSADINDPVSIKNTILKLYNMPKEERIKVGKQGREYVLKHFTYNNLAEKYIDIFEKEIFL